MANNTTAALSVAEIDAQIQAHQTAITDLQAQRLEALHREAGNPQVGDQVLFLRQDYINRPPDEYPATILAVRPGAVCDLSVQYGHGLTVRDSEYNTNGRPNTWHWPEQTTS